MQLITVHWAKMTKKMLMARALQMFMTMKRRWYLDLFAGKNDHEAVKRAGAAVIKKSTVPICPQHRSKN